MKIPDKTSIAGIDLIVNDLESSLKFYSGLIGLKEFKREGNISFLSANGNGPHLIKLTENKNAEIAFRGAPGLYHLALLFPSRKELARVFLRLFENGVKFSGFSDHLVSEAIYLSDPEGNGIELYADKPKETWNWKMGEVLMDSLPLDISKITDELPDRGVWNGIHEDTILGHVHLNIRDLNNAEKFYSNILGMNVTSYSYPGARFFSAGGYHHHIGTNNWSANSIPAKENSRGMESFTVRIPDTAFIEQVKKDADNAGLLLSENADELLIKDYENNKVRVVKQ